MTAPLAPSRFRFRVDLMPDEKVLWEGGAQRQMVWAQALKVAGSTLLLAAMMGAFLLYALSGVAPVDGGAESLADPALREKIERSEADFIETHRRIRTTIWRAASLAVIAFGIVSAFEAWLRWRKAWYVVTTERVCIQTGGFGTTLTTVDLDRIVSVQARASFIDKPFGLQDIELVHSGVPHVVNPSGLRMRNPYALVGIAKDDALLTHLVSEWLPRDGRRRTTGTIEGAA
jgi:hypothetical protein